MYPGGRCSGRSRGGSLPFALTVVVVLGAIAGARLWLGLLSPVWLIVALGLLLLAVGVGPTVEFVTGLVDLVF